MYGSITERPDQLRQRVIATADDSLLWLTKLFEVATDLKTAEEADEEGVLANLPDPNIGMLTRIFEENTPEGMTVMVSHVVTEVDTLVRPAVHDKWTSQEPSMKGVKRELRPFSSGTLSRSRVNRWNQRGVTSSSIIEQDVR